MREITLSDDAKQHLSAILDGYSAVSIYVEYKPQQYGWFLDLSWGSFSVNSLRLTTSPNILRQFKNILPFGIGVSGVGGAEPVNITDWSTGTCGFYILDSVDVANMEALIGG